MPEEVSVSKIVSEYHSKVKETIDNPNNSFSLVDMLKEEAQKDPGRFRQILEELRTKTAEDDIPGNELDFKVDRQTGRVSEIWIHPGSWNLKPKLYLESPVKAESHNVKTAADNILLALNQGDLNRARGLLSIANATLDDSKGEMLSLAIALQKRSGDHVYFKVDDNKQVTGIFIDDSTFGSDTKLYTQSPKSSLPQLEIAHPDNPAPSVAIGDTAAKSAVEKIVAGAATVDDLKTAKNFLKDRKLDFAAGFQVLTRLVDMPDVVSPLAPAQLLASLSTKVVEKLGFGPGGGGSSPEVKSLWDGITGQVATIEKNSLLKAVPFGIEDDGLKEKWSLPRELPDQKGERAYLLTTKHEIYAYDPDTQELWQARKGKLRLYWEKTK